MVKERQNVFDECNIKEYILVIKKLKQSKINISYFKYLIWLPNTAPNVVYISNYLNTEKVKSHIANEETISTATLLMKEF